MPATRADAARVASRRLAGHPRRTNALSRPSRYAWMLNDWQAPGGPYPATEAEAMGLPPFGRAVAILAQAIAGTPWFAERWDAELGVSIRLPDQPLVVRDPDPEGTPWSYRWGATEDGILYGNHFALTSPDRDARTGRPAFLVPVPADDVWILEDPETRQWWWTIGGQTFTQDEIFHVPYGNRSGEILGRGVLAQYGEYLGGAVAAERHSAGYFAGGALPPAVLTSPVPITQPQADELKGKWRELTQTREPLVLPAGYVLTPVVSNAEQAQLVESRTWDATLVADLVGVPYWMLGLQGPSMTYLNVEQSDLSFVRDYVDRWAQPLAAGFTKWLLPNGTDVTWNWTSRSRLDSATTANVLKTYTDAGLLTQDEARAVMGRPPLEQTTQPGTTPDAVPELTSEEVAS